MNRKIVLIDVLDDKFFNIADIFRSVLLDCGIPTDILVKIDGLRSKIILPQNFKMVGFIISGSVHHIYEEKGKIWKDNLCEFIRNFYEKIPILGVCFGHQAIAYALRGKVVPNEKGKTVGTLPLSVTFDAKTDPLFSEFENGSLVPLSHLDHVLTLPKQAIRLAYNQYAPNQAFRIGNSWGIQFHPELTSRVFRELISARIKSSEENSLPDEANTLRNVHASIKECPAAINVLKRFVLHCLNPYGNFKPELKPQRFDPIL